MKKFRSKQLKLLHTILKIAKDYNLHQEEILKNL
jgi:hypothetical protein